MVRDPASNKVKGKDRHLKLSPNLYRCNTVAYTQTQAHVGMRAHTHIHTFLKKEAKLAITMTTKLAVGR